MKRSFFQTSLVLFYCIVFTSCVMLSRTASAKPGPGQQTPPCGGAGGGGGGKDCNDKKPGSGCGNVGANPINPAKANAFREIIDITTFGAAPIEWARVINSRVYQHNGSSYWDFGYYGTLDSGAQSQSSWQSNWTWEVIQISTTLMRVRYPNGNDYDFAQISGTNPPQYSSTVENGDRLYKIQSSPHNKFMLVTTSGEEFFFDRIVSTDYYQMVQKRDGLGSYWDVSYDPVSPKRVKRITNNFGRWIEIEREPGPAPYYWPRIRRVYSGYGNTPDHTRDIIYNYSNWMIGSDTHSILTSVDYPGGEHANYAYTPVHFNGASKPLLGTANDPMYRGAGARVKYVYNRSEADGSIKEEHNLNPQDPQGEGELIVKIEQGGGTDPEISEGDGTPITRQFHSITGVLTAEADGEERWTTYWRDANGDGFINTIQEPNGAVTLYERDWAGRVKTQTHTFDNSTRKNSYNDYGFQLTQEDELHHLITWTRNATLINNFPNSRVTQKDYPDGTFETWSNFNQHSQPQTHRLRNGGTEYFTYDSFGNMLTKTDAEGKLTEYEYHPNGLLHAVKEPHNPPLDPFAHTTTYTYNWRGQILTITHQDNTVTSYEYDPFGNRTAVTDENGNKNVWTYDEYNRIKTVQDGLSRTTTYDYGRAPGCSCSYVSTISGITSPSGRVTTFSYDHADRIICKTEGAGTTDAANTTWAYDDVQGTVIRTDPRQNPWKDTYNAKHERISSEDPLHKITEWTYWKNGKKKTEKRPGANTVPTQFFYDEGDRLSKVIDSASHATELFYVDGDTLKPLWKIKDANQNIYEFSYDLLDRKKSLIYPGGNFTELYDYDPVGNLIQYTTRKGQIRASTFDNRHREIHVGWSDDTPPVDKTYDDAGRLLSMSSWVSTVSYTYNDANQVTSETQQVWPNYNPRSIGYLYNLDGERERLDYPSGNQVTTAYTARGQVETLVERTPSTLIGGSGFDEHVVAEYQYDENGNGKQRDLGNGTQAVCDYDEANRLTNIVHDSIASFSYGYYDVGTRKYVEREDGYGDVYGYDPTDQVTSTTYGVTNPSGSPSGGNRDVSYVYDSVGNRLSVMENGVPTPYSPDELNQYTAVGGDNPSYDKAGNLTGREDWAYDYDAQNRLISAWNNSYGYQFYYDARNRCVHRISWTNTINGWEGVDTNLYYDGWNLVEEQTDMDRFVGLYIHGARVDELVKRTTQNGDFYYHHDALGNTVALTDSDGRVVERYSYDVYGKPTFMDGDSAVVSNSPSGNRFLFTGREWLHDGSLYDYRNRFYSPEFGRFWQTDPIRFDAQEVNLYRYVKNSPTNATDPSGLDLCWGVPCTPPPDKCPSGGGDNDGDPRDPSDCQPGDTKTQPCYRTCFITYLPPRLGAQHCSSCRFECLRDSPWRNRWVLVSFSGCDPCAP